MAQNIYDNPAFFEGYAQLPRSVQGLDGAPEWPALKAMLPDLTGKSVVDLGCGYGWFCRAARELGASEVTGVDISEKMLARAAELTVDPQIHYQRSDLDALKLDESSLDLVYSSLALHYLPELDTLFARVQRALKPGGSLVFSMEHPIYTCASRQGWLTDDNGERFWGVNHYQDEGQRVSNWLADGVIKYHRTLGTTLNALIKAGLTISNVNEWGPTQAQIDAWPALAEEAERVRFHHMYWEKACDRGLAAREGSLINIADRVDVDLRAKNDFREAVEGADRRVCERRPGIYSPDHIEAMQDILHDEETLNDLAGAHIRLPAFVRRRYGDQILTPQETIRFSTLFGHIIDSCSPFTATHSTGVAHMAVALGRLTGMGQDDLDTLFVAGMLHDIGKLGIPLALLEKPGQLTDEEFPKVKRHADLSRLWLDAVPGFERVSVWGGGHHERLDGKGYPLGLKGEEIPLPSRIMAIADVFTALTEDRPYRKGMAPPEALRIVKGMVKQGHLDGDLSRLLCDHADELDAVRASSQAEARRGFQALHDACAEPDERLRD